MKNLSYQSPPFGKKSSSSIFIDTAGILLVSALLAFASNAIRPDGLPFIGDWSPEAMGKKHLGEDLRSISLPEAYQAFTSGRAFFLDARPIEEYEQGHIKGALGVPWTEVSGNARERYDFLPKEVMIITYCDGIDCPLSSDLARRLQQEGYSNVWVLLDGWSLWKNAGYPVEKGNGG